ncbi:hypothetical protein [Kitasatospora sp. NPDC056273]|uniref:hypothetical protein n=1 Tax=Kitasatospora sp. NPDC056273 TaxID=3345769 RepID=UPI0035DD999F
MNYWTRRAESKEATWPTPVTFLRGASPPVGADTWTTGKRCAFADDPIHSRLLAPERWVDLVCPQDHAAAVCGADFGDGGEAADRGGAEGGGIAELEVVLRQPLSPGP